MLTLAWQITTVEDAILYAAFDKTCRLDFGEAVCCASMTGTSWNV